MAQLAGSADSKWLSVCQKTYCHCNFLSFSCWVELLLNVVFRGFLQFDGQNSGLVLQRLAFRETTFTQN
jgi:hypothetical protein